MEAAKDEGLRATVDEGDGRTSRASLDWTAGGGCRHMGIFGSPFSIAYGEGSSGTSRLRFLRRLRRFGPLARGEAEMLHKHTDRLPGAFLFRIDGGCNPESSFAESVSAHHPTSSPPIRTASPQTLSGRKAAGRPPSRPRLQTARAGRVRGRSRPQHRLWPCHRAW
jgi:hypothetical protein